MDDPNVETLDARELAQKAYFMGRLKTANKLCEQANEVFDSLPPEIKEALLDRDASKLDGHQVALSMVKWPPHIRISMELLVDELLDYFNGNQTTFLSSDEWELFDRVVCLVAKLRLKSKNQIKYGLDILHQNEPGYLLLAGNGRELDVAFRHHITDSTKEFFFGGR